MQSKLHREKFNEIVESATVLWGKIHSFEEFLKDESAEVELGKPRVLTLIRGGKDEEN